MMKRRRLAPLVLAVEEDVEDLAVVAEEDVDVEHPEAAEALLVKYVCFNL